MKLINISVGIKQQWLIKLKKRNKKNPTKTGHNVPPDDRNTTNTVLPKQSNLGLVKPLDLAVTFQENRRIEKKKKKKVELLLSV